MKNSYLNINTISVIGNFLPRKCGIATFTADLVKSLALHKKKCITLAINDKPNGYNYPHDVGFEISQETLSDYHTAAEFLNTREVDIVSLQHEFGIFGGESGEYILSLLKRLKMPIVTTLHTVVTDPTHKQEQVMQQLAELTERFVVMSKTAIEILNSLYDIPSENIKYIPHGIPDMPFGDPNYYKDQFGLLGRKVLLTFGLLSQNKGIEYVIKGLPKVVERFPDLTYIVLGATHPNVLKTEGEKYRRELEQLVVNLNLEDHVIFKNEFVPYDKLCNYLSATDLYITPYTKAEQITSGTLAYASGLGKAIISTPYWYAKEMLSDGRGKLVPFKDEEAMADSIIEVFENEALLHKMRTRSYHYNRDATWDEVARQYVGVFQDIKSNYSKRSRPRIKTYDRSYYLNDTFKLPRLNINHLEMLTDSTGMVQHAKYTIPNRDHGYCTDDNARALIVAVKAQRLSRIAGTDHALLGKLTNKYLAFLLHAYNDDTGRFYNFMSYSRQWLDESAGSEDSHGRALWGLGTTVSLIERSPVNSLASKLFMRSLQVTESFESPRAIAFTIIGIDAYLKTYSGDSTARRIYTQLAEKLLKLYKLNARVNWPWFEDILAYSNGKLSHALILAGDTLKRDDMTQIGFKSLRWLLDEQCEANHLVPIGNHGWFRRNHKKARFDQQPLEANALIEASLAAYAKTDDDYWLDQAKICFSWFLGNNDLNLPLYNHETGGCHDGLEVDKVNQNQGAESTLAWLLSLIEMYELSDEEVSVVSKNGIKKFNPKKELQ